LGIGWFGDLDVDQPELGPGGRGAYIQQNESS
jgi:hypothetical protein